MGVFTSDLEEKMGNGFDQIHEAKKMAFVEKRSPSTYKILS